MSPLQLVAAARSSKKFVIEIETGHEKAAGSCETSHGAGLLGSLAQRAKESRGLAIKLNNFLLYGSSGCVLPYLSVYFLRYTKANSNDVGRFMSVSALLGTLVNFLVSSLSDRYQIHRQLYLTSLILVNLSFCVLLVPMLTASTQNTVAIGTSDTTHQSTTQRPLPDAAATTLLVDALETTSAPDEAPQVQTQATLGQQLEEARTIDQDEPVWFYLLGVCIAFGSLAITANMNFSDAFSTNTARQMTGPGASFGSLRFYGALGWCAANFVLAMVNKLDTGYLASLPYLLPAWVLFVLLSAANILLIASWPDKSPFELSAAPQPQQASSQLEREPRASSETPVALTRAAWIQFDALDGPAAEGARAKPSVRRCSVVPLGSSHVIEQFELGSADELDETSAHFRHITRIEHFKFTAAQRERVRLSQCLETQAARERKEQRNIEAHERRIEFMSIRLHLKIIELIARRNPNMIRSLSLYAVVGFIIATNWYFLFPYLELLDTRKFLTISAWIMMATYASETIFYYFSAHFTARLSAPNGLSAILFFFALRFSAYLTFAWWPAHSSPVTAAGVEYHWWPIELIVLVEALQALTMGWFDCIFNESALEFALEAEKCVPQLIELKLIEDTREAREQVKNGVKLSLLSVSSCFFDGVGVGLGSLLGGWIIDSFGYAMLWSTCASFALSVCLLNIALELTIFSGGGSGGGGGGAKSASDEINK